ncbi:MAG: NADH-quinone oxidoreductase subunit J [Deltaproteobacteria bacterium]|nr:NADH-quinone oxidoreductase subunit J [Deltaproteobacteria bacterium]
MNGVFYLSAIIGILATLMVVTRLNAVHALLYLIVSFFSVAVIFFVLGAPFVAALEIIIYAGAIMVLFVFVIMMLNLGSKSTKQEGVLLQPRSWLGPSVLSGILILEIIYLMAYSGSSPISSPAEIAPKQIGMALFGPYAIGVELASMLLLAGLVGAYHIGSRRLLDSSSKRGDKE